MASLQKATLTILSGATVSDELTADNLRNCRALSIQAPATLTGVVTVTSGDLDASGGNFTTVQSPPGTDITIAADKSAVLLGTPFPRLRLESTIAEGADRTFVVWLKVGE